MLDDRWAVTWTAEDVNDPSFGKGGIPSFAVGERAASFQAWVPGVAATIRQRVQQ